MESSQLIGGTEECSSSESGWTTYLASPDHAHDDDHDNDDDDSVNDDGGCNSDDDNNDGSDSDDSMASDASSGPAHHDNSYGKGRNCMSDSKRDDEDNDRAEREKDSRKLKGCSYKQIYKHKKGEMKKKGK